MLVDAFVLRVAAMSEESGGQLLIFPKYNIPTTKLRGPNKTCKVGGTLDYLLVLLPEDCKSDAGECGPRDLSDTLPEAVLQVAALTKRLK